MGMKLVRIGARWLSIRTVGGDEGWIARATRGENGAPFGIEATASSEGEAEARLVRWLEWQAAHEAALEALQAAERAYHRSVAAGAFLDGDDRPPADERRLDALRALNAARAILDTVRAEQPE